MDPLQCQTQEKRGSHGRTDSFQLAQLENLCQKHFLVELPQSASVSRVLCVSQVDPYVEPVEQQWRLGRRLL